MRSHYDMPAIALLVAAAVLASGCGDAPPADAAPDDSGPASEVVTLWTPHLELFMEYPSLVAGRQSEPWAIHLTRLDGFQPVRDGSLELAFTGPDGTTRRVEAAAPIRDGIYGPAIELPAGGSYDLVITFRSGDLTDEIWIGPVHVYGSESELPTTPPEPETGIILLKEQQWTSAFGTAEVTTRRVVEALPAPGELVAPDGAVVAVNAPLAGLLTAATNRNAPSVGARVRRGDVLATLTSADGDGSWSALVAKVEHLERETRRLEPLYAAEAIPERRLETARHELAAARRSLDALGVAADSGALLRVRAPIDGVIAARDLRIGSRASAGDALFTIAAPGTVWARFRVPAAQAGVLPAIQSATFRVEGDTTVHHAGRPVSVSQTVDPETRSLSIAFAASDRGGALRVGMLVQGSLRPATGESGPAIPTAAIRLEDGVPVAYVQVAGELFQRRALATGPSDGEWTRVLGGVRAGERVVVRGAYQVRLASLNPAAVSDHGHPH